MTPELDQRIKKRICFLDTPGLSNITLARAAGKSILDGLKKGGNYKVIFFFTEQSGDINDQDVVIMRMVLEAAPDIGNKYGIIVNKVDRKVRKELKRDQGTEMFLQTLFTGMPDTQICREDQVLFLPALERLEDEDNELVSAADLVSDVSRTDLQTFVDECVPKVQIIKENVADVNTKSFVEMMQEMEKIQRKAGSFAQHVDSKFLSGQQGVNEHKPDKQRTHGHQSNKKTVIVMEVEGAHQGDGSSDIKYGQQGHYNKTPKSHNRYVSKPIFGFTC